MWTTSRCLVGLLRLLFICLGQIVNICVDRGKHVLGLEGLLHG